jgi:hypothetical protein
MEVATTREAVNAYNKNKAITPYTLKEVLKSYGTLKYIKDAIEKAEISGGGGSDIDLSEYAKKSELPTKTSQLTNDSNFVQTINGILPSSILPSYVDDVLEYATKSAFPNPGTEGKIYVDNSTNLTYRWGGSTYVEISPSLALGETEHTAFRGDHGLEAYNHIFVTGNPHSLTLNDLDITIDSETINRLEGLSENILVALSKKLNLTGGELTGYLTLHHEPVNPMHAANRQYVDNIVDGISVKVTQNVTNIANLTSDVNGLNSTVKTTVDTLTEVKDEVRDINQVTTDHTEYINTLTNDVAGINATVEKTSETVTQLTNDLGDVTENMSTLATKSELDIKAGEITSEINQTLSDGYTTKAEANAIEQKITDSENRITLSVSQTYTTKEEADDIKQEAISEADSNTADKLKDYTTTTNMNSAINKAKGEAITSANSNTDTKLKDYSTTSEIEGKLELKIDADDNNKIVSMLNMAADDINITSDRFSLDSTNAKITKEGIVDFVKGSIGSIDIGENYLRIPITVDHTYTQSDVDTLFDKYTNGDTFTEEEIKFYDVTGDGKISLADTAKMYNLVTANITKDKPGAIELLSNSVNSHIAVLDGDGKVRSKIDLNGVTANGTDINMSLKELYNNLSGDINTRTIIGQTESNEQYIETQGETGLNYRLKTNDGNICRQVDDGNGWLDVLKIGVLGTNTQMLLGTNDSDTLYLRGENASGTLYQLTCMKDGRFLLEKSDDNFDTSTKLAAAGYRVNDVIITYSDTNPAGQLGGTWSQVDVEMTPATISNPFTLNATNTTSAQVSATRLGHYIFIEYKFVPKVALSDSEIEVLTFNLTSLGVTQFCNIINHQAFTDGGNCVAFMNVAKNGRMASLDVIPDKTISAGQTIFGSFMAPIAINHMTARGKRYWRKTA